MRNSKTKLLIIGIGNYSRRDDGLGWAFLDELQKKNIAGVELIYKYQLNIEDADLISNYSNVVFIDAFNGKLEKGFSFEKCVPANSFEFTTHALSPGVIVALCQNLYNSIPKAYILKIQGSEWELKDGLSKQSAENLQKGLNYFHSSNVISDFELDNKLIIEEY